MSSRDRNTWRRFLGKVRAHLGLRHQCWLWWWRLWWHIISLVPHRPILETSPFWPSTCQWYKFPFRSSLLQAPLSIALFQVFLGRPLLRSPCGFQFNAFRSIDNAGLLKIQPSHAHFLFLISTMTGTCFFLPHSSPSAIISELLMFMLLVRRRQRFVNVCKT
jgi:hypothetical protein